MKQKMGWIFCVFTLFLGVIIGCYWNSPPEPKQERKPLYWIDSMEPQIHYPGPGKSRMGMDLTPVYPDKAEGQDQSMVQISPEVIQNLGIRTAPVTVSKISRSIETVGYIEPNENQISHVHTYVDGWAEKLIVKAVGEPVKKGQVLLQFYSPALVNAQEEYLIALESHNQNLIDASYKRLMALHVSEKQIEQLKKNRKASHLINIYAPHDGIISALNIREGMRVTPETEIMSLLNLSSIWMIAQIYEDQASWVNVGEELEARISAFPDKVWKGKIEYIYPEIDSMTRTLKVRLLFNNPEGILKPNMYANIHLLSHNKPNVLTVPVAALIRTNKEARVVISRGEGRFEVRTVRPGIESGESVEILSGLQPGEQVVVSGQFLIDSEANLKASLQRLHPSHPKKEKH